MAFHLDKRMDITQKHFTVQCPPILALARWLGENRLLTAGGVLNQPAGAWRACNYALYLDDLMKRRQSKDFEPRDDRENLLVNQMKELAMQHPEWMG